MNAMRRFAIRTSTFSLIATWLMGGLIPLSLPIPAKAVGFWECTTLGNPQQCSSSEAYAYCMEHSEYRVSRADPSVGESKNPFCYIDKYGTQWMSGLWTRTWTNPQWAVIGAQANADFFNISQSKADSNKNNECPTGTCNLIGNPINFLTGAKLETVTDFEVAGHELKWRRFYSSVALAGNELGSLGAPWRHNFAIGLQITEVSGPGFNETNAALLARPSGDQYLFFRDPAGTWTPDADVAFRLVELLENGVRIGWQVHTPDNVIEHFDLTGCLLSVSYPDGEMLSLTYAGSLLSQVTDRQGRRIQLEYTGDLLTSVILPDGGVIGYQFDSSRRLTNVTYPDQGTIAYRYDNASFPFALTSRTDESGATYAAWEYDSYGRATRSVHGDPAGKVDEVRIAYGTGTVTVTNALGESSVHQVLVQHGRAKSAGASKSCVGCGGTYATGSFDANGYPALYVAFNGARTLYAYNPRGLKEREEQAGSDALNRRVIETTWHSSFRLPVELRTYDAAGSLVAKTNWSYNGRGQPLTYSGLDPATGGVRTKIMTYCEQPQVEAGQCPRVGLVLSVDGSRADVPDLTTYAYYPSDAPGCEIDLSECRWRKGDLWRTTDAVGQVAEIVRYDAAGRVLSSRHGDGMTTDITYDMRGRVIARTVRGSN